MWLNEIFTVKNVFKKYMNIKDTQTIHNSRERVLNYIILIILINVALTNRNVWLFVNNTNIIWTFYNIRLFADRVSRIVLRGCECNINNSVRQNCIQYYNTILTFTKKKKSYNIKHRPVFFKFDMLIIELVLWVLYRLPDACFMMFNNFV